MRSLSSVARPSVATRSWETAACACVHPRVHLVVPKRYSIAEARSNLASIVDQAEAGQEIELTRRGKPVAVVVSLRELERLRGERVPFGDAYRRFLKVHPLRDVGVEEDVFERARDRGPGRKVSL
jgi:prevent-host-death family protein